MLTFNDFGVANGHEIVDASNVNDPSEIIHTIPIYLTSGTHLVLHSPLASCAPTSSTLRYKEKAKKFSYSSLFETSTIHVNKNSYMTGSVVDGRLIVCPCDILHVKREESKSDGYESASSEDVAMKHVLVVLI